MTNREQRARWLGVWAAMLVAPWCLRSGWTIAGLVLTAAGGLGLAGQDLRQPPRRAMSWRWWLAGLALVAVALVLRLWRIESVPPVWWDEGVEGHDARCVAAGMPLEPLDGIYYHRGPVWLALLALTGRVAGFSLVTLRSVAAAAGTLLTGLGAFLAAGLFGGWAGVLAGGWIAVHAWPLNMSRILIGNILVPVAAVAIVAAALRASWSWRLRAAVVGLLGGISQYGYVAALQLPALGAAALWWFAPARESRGSRLKAVALSLGLAALCVAPYRLVYGGLFDKAANVSALADPSLLAGNVLATLPLFHAHGDDDLRHQYPAGVPVLDPALAACFSIGLALALWNLRKPRWALLLVWLGLGLSPGIASAGGERNLFRMIGAIPPVAMLCAAGAMTLPRAFGDRLGRGLAAAVWLASAAVGLRTYFLVFPKDRATGVWYRTYDLDAALELEALAARRPLVLREPLTLTLHPLARFELFEAMRTGRVTTAPAPTDALRVRTTYQDSYGVPQAVLLTGDERALGRLPVALVTVLAAGEAGDALMKADRARDAVALDVRMVALMPRSGVLHERLGFAALKAGDPARARAAFARAIVLGSKFPATYDGLGEALWRLGRRADAVAALAEAVRLGGGPGIEADLARVRGKPADTIAP